MQKLIIILMSALLLSSCSFIPVHKMDIEQGNIITPELANRVHPGMTESQVRDVMGSPVLLNTFNDNRVDYIYTFKPGRGYMGEKNLILTFVNGTLRDIKGNIYTHYPDNR